MSINFSTLQGLTIPEGVVTQIAKDGVVLWSASKGCVITINGETAVGMCKVYIDDVLYAYTINSTGNFVPKEVIVQKGTKIKIVSDGANYWSEELVCDGSQVFHNGASGYGGTNTPMEFIYTVNSDVEIFTSKISTSLYTTYITTK